MERSDDGRVRPYYVWCPRVYGYVALAQCMDCPELGIIGRTAVHCKIRARGTPPRSKKAQTASDCQ